MSDQNHPTPNGQKYEPRKVEEPLAQDQAQQQGQSTMPPMPPGVNPFMDRHPIYSERIRLQGEVAGIHDQLETMREIHAQAVKSFEEDSLMLEACLKNARRTLRNVQLEINAMEQQARQAQQAPPEPQPPQPQP